MTTTFLQVTHIEETAVTSLDELVNILLVKLTGSKLPDPACYGHTQFHLVPDRYHRDRMANLQQSDQVEAFLRANGIASLFAWTGAQAMYQGEYG